MYSFLRRPRWLVLATVVGLIALLFVNLGLWQLRRLEERRFDNAIQAERRSSDPVPLDVAVSASDPIDEAGEEHDGRPVSAVGVFDATEEVLLRSRTHQGQAGYHVLTPLLVADGSAVIVNRGWVPLEFDSPPVSGAASAPAGSVMVSGHLAASATQPRFGPQELPGDRDVMVRSDLARLAEQIDYPLYPVLLVEQHDRALPIAVELEELDDGPHLPYAIQWFAFAIISIGGFAALARSTARRTGSQSTSSGEIEEPILA